MSYSIYYDRAFIRVGDKYIPLAISGSNNCFESGYSGRWRCEKNWNVLNWQHSRQFLFTEPEIKDIARVYDQYNQESGMIYKSRNRCFAPGEFERWVIGGMRRAYTVEEYVSFGNGFFVLDYSPAKTGEWVKHPFLTTDELLDILENLKTAASVDIKLADNREIYRPKANRAPKKTLKPEDLPEYYVLKGEYEGRTFYFAALNRSGGFRYSYDHPISYTKPFLSEKAAEQYLKKHHDRLGKQFNFTPERIVNAA